MRTDEAIFFGLSARQFICAILAVGLAAGIYLGLGGIIGREAASWLCLLAAAPVVIAGFLHYNGMTLEQFLWAFIKSEILCRPRAALILSISMNCFFKHYGGHENDEIPCWLRTAAKKIFPYPAQRPTVYPVPYRIYTDGIWQVGQKYSKTWRWI